MNTEAVPTNVFCKAMTSSSGDTGMTMYMEGFQMSLINSSSKTCLNFFISGWTLNTRLKFFLAMIAVVCLGITIDGLSWLKRQYVSSLVLAPKRKRFLHCGDVEEESKDSSCDTQEKIILIAFQFVQVLSGYILMLSAMTYSIELLISATIGLTIGSYLFGKQDMLLSRAKNVMKMEQERYQGTAPLSVSISDHLDDSAGSPCCHDISEESPLIASSERTNDIDYISISPGRSSDVESVL